MIKHTEKLSIQRLPLAQLQVVETICCYLDKFNLYHFLLTENPDQDVDPLLVAPSPKFPGMYTILNGKHRFAASILAGRSDALCLVVEEEEAS